MKCSLFLKAEIVAPITESYRSSKLTQTYFKQTSLTPFNIMVKILRNLEIILGQRRAAREKERFWEKTHKLFLVFFFTVIYFQDDLPRRWLWACSFFSVCDTLQFSTMVAPSLLQLLHLRLPLHFPASHHARMQRQNHLHPHSGPSTKPTQYVLPRFSQ